MVWLDSELNDLPAIFLRNLFNDLLETVIHWPYQNFFSPFRAENEVVEHVVNGMLFVNIVLVHVDKYGRYN